ncbi:hypothetical protein NXH64_06280 [Butyrivibrio fibrisolvens]|uniref:sulfatase-like hydrolase/transferase n=1 Tax=Pseudobutyrivibrio ruminis TaxID=46206 RepID=UPI00040FAEBB|nr:sulfatase-like hydrolase/transferase [Pseudobutyrivibrio ruminis]MDC7279113.1 hypothetical protein [Butyrivibrio fibrisolvens]
MIVCDEIDSLILKYNLDRFYPNYRKSIFAKELLTEIFAQLPHGEIVHLLGESQDDVDHVCECIANDNISITKAVVPSENDSRVSVSEYNHVFWTSLKDSTNIKQKMKNDGIVYVDIYDIFKNANLEFGNDFYHVFDEEQSYAEWDNDTNYKKDELYQYEFNMHYKKYEEAECLLERKECLIRCVFIALLARDFVLFNSLANYDEIKKEFAILQEEINKILSGIEKKIKAKLSDDILVFWIDAVAYGDRSLISFWNKKKENALTFENAYTVTPNTKPTLRAMFCQKTEVSDRGYKIKEINKENSPLIRYLENSGYRVKSISGYYGTLADKIEIKRKFGFRAQASLILWNLVQQLVNSDENQFIISHFFIETHYPYLSLGKYGYDNDEQIRKDAGEKKIDEQLTFYERFMPNNAIRIYMSDHGKGRDLSDHHINFDIVSSSITKKRISKFFSIIDFYYVIKDLAEYGELKSKIYRDSVPIEVLDIYNKNNVRKNLESRVNMSPLNFGYVGDLDRKYVRKSFSNGIKWGAPLKCYDKYLPDNSAKEQIYALGLRIRGLHEAFPNEILMDDKFKYSRLMHVLYAEYMDRLSERLGIIERIFFNYSNNEIVLRMGGVHSFMLLKMLSPRAKKKISLIIDNNADCVCNGQGKQILSQKDFLEQGIKNCKAILISSYHNRCFIYDEIRQGLYDGLEIIDLYTIFEQEEIACTSDFYDAIYEDDYKLAITMLEEL